jgi:hypothetical protein
MGHPVGQPPSNRVVLQNLAPELAADVGVGHDYNINQAHSRRRFAAHASTGFLNGPSHKTTHFVQDSRYFHLRRPPITMPREIVLLLIGDVGSGKTSFVKYATGGTVPVDMSRRYHSARLDHFDAEWSLIHTRHNRLYRLRDEMEGQRFPNHRHTRIGRFPGRKPRHSQRYRPNVERTRLPKSGWGHLLLPHHRWEIWRQRPISSRNLQGDLWRGVCSPSCFYNYHVGQTSQRQAGRVQ